MEGPPVIRGYNQTIDVTFEIKNADVQHQILSVTNPRENFAFELYFLNTLSSRRKRVTSPDIGPFTVIVFNDTSTGLPSGSSKSYTGTVQFLIPRDKCSSLHFMCGSVAAGTGASYTINGSNPFSCINFDPLKNCDGK